MADFHRNIFSYYRGAIHHEHEREQQQEDNTTKALINTLEYCCPEVATKFLKWLEVHTSDKVDFLLQATSIGSERISRKSQRLLLAIVGAENQVNESICNQLPGKPVGDSRPDAWIFGQEFVVLLESKTGARPLELNQMACHWSKLKPTALKIVTWAEVHKFFVAIARELKEAKSRWLVEQFTRYLEWTGMTEFVGFEEGMFEFFVPSEKDPDTKKWVRGAVEGLADKVLNDKQGLKQFDSFYEDKHVGNFKDADHYWVAFGPKGFRERAHQTISLYEQKLDVFVNVELLPPIKKLRKKVVSGAGFRQVVSQLPEPFTVRIEERKPTHRPREFDYYLIAEVEGGVHQNCPYGLKDPKSSGFDYVETLLQKTEFPYLSVRRSIPRKRVLELSKPNGDALVDEVIGILKAFHPLVEFINQ